MNPDRGPDALQWFLTAAGARTSVRIRGLGAIVTRNIPSMRVDNVLPACGEGSASLVVDANDDLIFTPPDGDAGDPVTVPEGQSRVLQGLDPNKAIRVYREAGLPYTGIMEMSFVDIFNGAIAQGNLTSAQRAAGHTTYRSMMLFAPADEVRDIKLWVPTLASQASWSLGTETPVAGVIQTTANETIAPTGIVWSTPTTEGTALSIPLLAAGAQLGLWIRRVFPPAGIVAARELVQLSSKFQGA